jgi:ribose 5-phosphate isomerase A
MVIVCDSSKQVQQLGRFPLPIEVVPFGWKHTKHMVEEVLLPHVASNQVNLRVKEGTPIITDSQNFILDCECQRIQDPRGLSLVLNQIPGVVENGLFLYEANTLVVGKMDGNTEVLSRTTLKP